MKKILKRTMLLIMTSIILLTTTVQAASTQVIYPAYSDSSYTLPNGGEWIRTTIVSTSNPVVADGMFTSIVWYSPDQVRALYESQSHFTSKAKFKEAAIFALETSFSLGAPAAQKAIIAKFGQKVLTNLLPFLGAIGWAKTGIDFISILNEANDLRRLETAIGKNAGLVYATNGYLSWWDYWNTTDSVSKGQFGTYPKATIPNVGTAKDICYGNLYKNLTN